MVSVGTNRISRWYRIRVQLGGGLLLAAILPYFVRMALLIPDEPLIRINQTLIACVVAIIVGTWLFRSLVTYPGVKMSSYIVPAFSLSYALVVTFLVLGRFEYNRSMLLSSFVISVIWFYVVYAQSQKSRNFRIGIVPLGSSVALQNLPGVNWVLLHDPTESFALVQAVATDLREDLPDAWERRLAACALEGVPVYHSKHLRESLTGRVELEHLSENNFGSLAPVSAYMTIKHAFDWLVSAAALLVLLPLFALVAVAVKLNSPGPAFFKQTRIGYRGRAFSVYKFRTMFVREDYDVDLRSSAMTRDHDDRITSVGRFLRRTRIDELPQIINILRGEMSWIGPRPEAEVLSRWYENEIPFYRYRHIVRPGISGWAQVNQGHVAEVEEVTSKLHYDFFYIKNFSPWIDVLIASRTIRIIFTGFGAR